MVFVWKLANKTTNLPLGRLRVQVLDAHAGDVNCLDWSKLQPNLLLSAGEEGAVKVRVPRAGGRRCLCVARDRISNRRGTNQA